MKAKKSNNNNKKKRKKESKKLKRKEKKAKVNVNIIHYSSIHDYECRHKNKAVNRITICSNTSFEATTCVCHVGNTQRRP